MGRAGEVAERAGDDDDPEEERGDGEGEMDGETDAGGRRPFVCGVKVGRRGGAMFPAVDADVELEEHDGDEEDAGHDELQLLVQIVTVADFDEINADGEDGHDDEHRQKDDIEHQRAAAAEKTAQAGVGCVTEDEGLWGKHSLEAEAGRLDNNWQRWPTKGLVGLHWARFGVAQRRQSAEPSIAKW